jgi:hypothetical protein
MVVKMEGSWLCLAIDIQFIRMKGMLPLLQSEVHRIFGDDFLDMVVIGEKLCEDHFEMLAENYIFVKCANYDEHIDELKRSKIVIGVLDNYDRPNFISEEEILTFQKRIERDKKYGVLYVGDVVKVREGYLKNLKGVVVKVINDNYYDVMFKLHTRTFSEEMTRKNLEFEKNIFDKIKIPVIECDKPSKSRKLDKPLSASAKTSSFARKPIHENGVRGSKHRKNGRIKGKKKRKK